MQDRGQCNGGQSGALQCIEVTESLAKDDVRGLMIKRYEIRHFNVVYNVFIAS